MPLAYVFAAWKMEAQPVLATAGVSSQELGVRTLTPTRHAGTPSPPRGRGLPFDGLRALSEVEA